MNRAATAKAALILCLLAGLVVTAACLAPKARGSALARSRDVPIRVRILSSPTGALVTDLVTGRDLGTTPLEYDALVLRFEEWTVLNSPQDRERLLRRQAPADEALLAVASDPDSPRLEHGTATDLVLRYRLRLQGHQPTILTHRIRAEELPLLQRAPLVEIEAHLSPLAQ